MTTYTIPKEWLEFCSIGSWNPDSDYYPYTNDDFNIKIIDINEIMPPTRNSQTEPFKKYKMAPILLAFQSPECALPPISLIQLAENERYRFKVTNGFHRFYASQYVGYKKIPAKIQIAH